MAETADNPNAESPPGGTPLPLSPRGDFFRQHAWVAFLSPLIAYMVVPMAMPASPPGDHLTEQHFAAASEAYASAYVQRYTVMAMMALPIAILLARGLHLPKFRVSALAIAVGVVGVVLWVGIDKVGIKESLRGLLGAESWLVGILGLAPRDAFNPVEMLGDEPFRYWWFMTVRFIGLALIVPVIEELMLRGWLMRVADTTSSVGGEFWQIPFGEVTLRAAAIGVGFEVLIHPEKIAALVWFSLVTWLMFKTKNFWDCVAAHAVTNFLLGVWVVWSGEWALW